MGKRPGAWVKAFLSAFLFGVSTPISKILLDQVPPFLLAALFYLGTAAVLLPGSVSLQVKAPVGRLSLSDRLNLWGSLFFGGMVGPVLLLYGLQYTSATDAAMLLNLETPATAALAFACFKENMTRKSITANLGILAAGILLTFQGKPDFGWGALLISGACLAWGLDNNHTASIHSIDAVRCTFLKGAVFGSVNLCIALWLMALLPPWPVILTALAVGALCYGISIVLYISAARQMGAARSQMVFASAPFFGVAMAQLLLGEGLQGIQVLSALIMMAMLFVLYSEQHSHLHEHLPVWHTHRHSHTDGHHRHSHPAAGEGDPGNHSHEHAHPYVRHRHMHLPDVHHRHKH
jgi:drug/metabolite transporter (DMT)-like permease